ncbi:hypothetical protein ACJMK2_013493 [Sinanodonta woodiana]|uniref:Uncharacterized protein n=1 Tax=Sinanodonta woodiana TaxID=1069815 RepID=A0ABD3UYX1_SINWO
MKIKKLHFRKLGEPDVHINPSERQLFSPTVRRANMSDTLNYFTSVLPRAVVSIQFQDPAPEEQNTCQIPVSDMETLSLSFKSLPEVLEKLKI